MTSIWKRSLSLFLAIVMVLGNVPFNALAVEEEVVEEVLEEEVFEEVLEEEPVEEFEEVVEEEILEEVFEEEVVEEEIFEEEETEAPAEETEAPAEETEDVPVEETEEVPAEEQEEPVVSVRPAGQVAAAGNDADGEIWVNRGNMEEEVTAILFKVKEEVLGALRVSEEDFDAYTVLYRNVDVEDVEFLKEQAKVGSDLYNEVVDTGYAVFTVEKDGVSVNKTIDFSDSRTDVTITYGGNIESMGKPDDMEALIREQIAVTGKNPQTGETVEVTYTVDFDSEYKWAATPSEVKSESWFDMDTFQTGKFTLDVAVELDSTVYDVDNLKNKTHTYNLVDTTPVYTITYMVDGEQYDDQFVLFAIPEEHPVKDPSKDLYDFVQWNVEQTANGTDFEVTYTAEWKASTDKNTNTIPDETETFTYMFMRGNGDYTMHQGSAKGGAPLSEVLPPDSWFNAPWADGKTRYFIGWDPMLPESGVVEAPAQHNGTAILFMAQWSEAPTVSFVSPATGDVDQNQIKEVKDGKVEIPAANNWKGYYVTGWKTEDGQDFVNENIEESMTLTPVFFDDVNGNAKKDGCAEDPWQEYQWFVDGDKVNEVKNRLVNDGKPEVKDSDYQLTAEQLKDRLLVKWEAPAAETKTEGDVHTVIHKFEAVFTPDVNNNGKPDSGEMITIDFTSDMGEVYVGKVEANNGQAFPYDADYSGNITIKAVPVVNKGISETYVAAINLVSGEEKVSLPLTYDKEFAATHKLKVENIVALAEEAVEPLKIEVVFAEAKLSMKENPVLFAHEGSYTAEEVYGAIVDRADAIGEAEVTAEYLAREANKQVAPDVSELLDIVMDKQANLYDYFYEEYYLPKVGSDNCYEYTYKADKWVDVTEAPASVTTVDQAVAAFMNKLWGMTVDEIEEKASKLMSEMEDSIEAAEIATFGKGTQTINISYTDAAMHLEAKGVALTVEDARAETEIKIADKTFVYGQAYTLGDLVSGATVYADGAPVANAQVTIKVPDGTDVNDYLGLGKGTYTITLAYAETEEHQYAEVSYKLNITPATGVVKVPERIVVARNENYNPIEEYNTDFIHIIAGMDINSAEISLENNSFDKVSLKAWIQLPQRILDFVDLANEENVFGQYLDLKLGQEQEKTLDDIEDLISTVMDAMGTEENGAEDLTGQILDALNQIRDIIATAEQKQANLVPNPVVKITFYGPEQEMYYPNEIGVFVNMACIYDVDGNYTNAFSKGVLLVHPGSALPSTNPNFQLSYNGDVKHMFNITADGQKKALEVAGFDCDIYYFGITLKGDLYANGAPTEPGLYVASTVYTDAANNMYSDAALMIVSAEATEIKLESKSDLVEDGTKHKLTPTNIPADAAYTLISAEMDLGADMNNLGITVNVDFPEGFNDILEILGNKLSIDLKLPDDANLYQLTKSLEAMPSKIKTALEEKVMKTLDEKVPFETLEKIGVSKDTIDDLLAKITGSIDGVIAQLNTFMTENGIDEQTAKQIQVSFQKHAGYDKAGVYFYAAVVTDPDYAPSADVAYMIVETDKLFDAEDVEYPYTGEEYDIPVSNETGKGYFTMVRNGTDLNLILDSDKEQAVLDKIVKLIKDKTGKEIGTSGTVNVSELLEAFDNKADGLAGAITEIIFERLEGPVNKIENKLNANEYTGFVADMMNKVLEVAKNKLSAVEQKLTGKLVDLFTEKVDGIFGKYAIETLTLNGPLPKDPGTYQFYAVGYAVAFDEATMEIKKELFDIAGATVSVGETLDMYFIIPKAELNGEDYYVTITKTYADGRKDRIETIQFSDWEVYANPNYYKVLLDGLNTLEMMDEIYVTVYNSDGSAASNQWTDSINNYIIRNIKQNLSKDDAKVTLLVDTLNFGASMQIMKSYDPNNLATTGISEYQSYATKEVSYQNTQEKGKNYLGTRIEAEGEIIVGFAFANLTEDMTGYITYTDTVLKQEINLVVPGSEFKKLNGFHIVNLNGMPLYNGRQSISCVVKDADGQIVGEVKDSIESYVARSIANNGSGDSNNAAYENMLKFADSAYTVFVTNRK